MARNGIEGQLIRSESSNGVFTIRKSIKKYSNQYFRWWIWWRFDVWKLWSTGSPDSLLEDPLFGSLAPYEVPEESASHHLGHSSAEERGAKHSPLTLEAILEGNNVLGVEHVDASRENHEKNMIFHIISWKLIRTPVRHRKHVLSSPQVIWRPSEMFTYHFLTKLIFQPRNGPPMWPYATDSARNQAMGSSPLEHQKNIIQPPTD